MGCHRRFAGSNPAHPTILMDCPTCEQPFEDGRAAKIHHKLKHGESIAIDTSTCDGCGDTFKYYPSDKSGVYCPSCVSDDSVSWGGTKLFGEDNPMFGKTGRDNPMFGKTGEDSPTWRGGYDDTYNGEWHSKRKEALQRDDHTCQRCERSREELGQSPDVHHIEPVRTFDDPKDAHYVDNLVSLCRRCHGLVEHGGAEI